MCFGVNMILLIILASERKHESPRRKGGISFHALCTAGSTDFANSKKLPAVQQNGYWSIINQFKLHHLAEASGFDFADNLAGRSHKVLVKWFGNFGLSSVAPGRAQAAAHIAVKRKLRNHKQCTSRFVHGYIHASVVIVKDSERYNFFR